MRRAIVTGTAAVSGVVLLLGMKPHTGGSGSGAGPLARSGANAGQAPDAVSGTTTVPKSTSSSGGKPSPAANSSTRVVTGDAVDTRYGPVQVRVTFSGKKITKAEAIQYPTESGRDAEINSYAIPQLNQQAMQVQSANIDGVSGATFTSEGYQQSLQSAIDKANA